MIKHIVMWRLLEEAEGNTKGTNLDLVKRKLYDLKSVIDEIDSLEVGDNINESEAAYDLVLITTHHDKNALVAYNNHPRHQEVASFIGKVVKERVVVDYEK